MVIEAIGEGRHFDMVCEEFNITDFMAPYREAVMMQNSLSNLTAAKREELTQEMCANLGLCKDNKVIEVEKAKRIHAATGIPDFRVTPVFGAKGYPYVRVSLVTEDDQHRAITTTPQDLFTYSSGFRFRWTNKHLQSGLLPVTPGEVKSITVADVAFDILLPREGSGVRGVILADPCFSGSYVGCTYGSKLQTFERITGFINAASELPPSKGGIDFWMILGDNFYDRDGHETSQFFNALTAKAKSKIFAATPGNHDYWAAGSALISSKKKDQFANGFMQYYAMDTVASRNDSVKFIDFENSPDKGGPCKLKKNVPKQENFQSYFKIGNLGFISYSAIYPDEEQRPFLEEACHWLGGQSEVSTAFIIGHWNNGNLGAARGMSVPNVRSKVNMLEGCNKFGDNLKYFMGHTHCNEVTETGVGFMVAGMGMEGCGNFGVPVVDSTSDKTEVFYYPIQDAEDASKGDKYNVTVSCFEENGVGGCISLADKWA